MKGNHLVTWAIVGVGAIAVLYFVTQGSGGSSTTSYASDPNAAAVNQSIIAANTQAIQTGAQLTSASIAAQTTQQGNALSAVTSIFNNSSNNDTALALRRSDNATQIQLADGANATSLSSQSLTINEQGQAQRAALAMQQDNNATALSSQAGVNSTSLSELLANLRSSFDLTQSSQQTQIDLANIQSGVTHDNNQTSIAIAANSGATQLQLAQAASAATIESARLNYQQAVTQILSSADVQKYLADASLQGVGAQTAAQVAIAQNNNAAQLAIAQDTNKTQSGIAGAADATQIAINNANNATALQTTSVNAQVQQNIVAINANLATALAQIQGYVTTNTTNTTSTSQTQIAGQQDATQQIISQNQTSAAMTASQNALWQSIVNGIIGAGTSIFTGGASKLAPQAPSSPAYVPSTYSSLTGIQVA